MATPVDLVKQFKQQGYSNNQIVQQMQGQGYKSNQIFDALNQADLQHAGPVAGMGAPQQQPAQPGQAPAAGQPQQGHVGGMVQMPPPMQQGAAQPAQSSGDEGVELGDDTEKIEEIVESIVEEKWEELVKSVNKIVEWKEKTESRLTKIETNFDNLKSGFDNLHNAVLGKISDYEHGLQDIGTDIKALEKVFQKILPTLTENVNELSRITKGMGSKEKKK
jgi:hypothetical protein